MKKLTIIIVSWNTSKLTIDCLSSLYDFGVSYDWDIVVVDNNSSDNTVEEIKNQFPNVKLIINNKNIGFAGANNQAIKQFNSKYYLLLNSDTLVISDVIQKSLAFLENNSDIGAMGCRVLNEDKTVQLTCSMFPTILNLLLQLFALDNLKRPKFLSRYQIKHWSRDSERDVDVISGCYLLIKKEVIEEVGILDEDFFFFGEETDWCTRIKNKGWRLTFSPTGEIIHYGGGSAKKLNYKRDLLLTNAIVRLHKKHFGSLNAILVYIILFTFSFTRYLGWGLISLLKPNETAKNRSRHFLSTMFDFHLAWPGENNATKKT